MAVMVGLLLYLNVISLSILGRLYVSLVCRSSSVCTATGAVAAPVTRAKGQLDLSECVGSWSRTFPNIFSYAI